MNEKNLTAGQWSALVKAVRVAEARAENAAWPNADYAASRTELTAARETLRSAMRDAPHGLKMPASTRGCVFLTENALSIGSVEFTKTLWINRRRVACMNDDGYISLVDRSMAKTEREVERGRGREQDRKYKALREQLAHELVRAGVRGSVSFGDWECLNDGQKGGYFRRSTDRVTVSARGALKRAAVIRQEQLEYLEDELLDA